MTDNTAVLQGYTEEWLGTCPEADLYLLCKPDTDFDSTFTAFDTDNQEFVRINGWLWSFESLSH
jgi:hypothetical protein